MTSIVAQKRVHLRISFSFEIQIPKREGKFFTVLKTISFSRLCPVGSHSFSQSVSKVLVLSSGHSLFPARCLASDEADSNRDAERITLKTAQF